MGIKSAIWPQPPCKRDRRRCLLKLISKLKPSLNILVKLRFLVPVVGQRRVDLPHGQIGMWEMQLFRAPPICEMVYSAPHEDKWSWN